MTMIRKANPPAPAGNEMASATELPSLRAAFYVGKRKPLADLSWWKRWLIRLAYRGTKWASDYGIEAQAICTDQELAEQMCLRGGPHWFFHVLPVNVSLPDETVRFRLHTFPGSDVRQMYEDLRIATVAVPIDDLEDAHRKLDHLVKTARAG